MNLYNRGIKNYKDSKMTEKQLNLLAMALVVVSVSALLFMGLGAVLIGALITYWLIISVSQGLAKAERRFAFFSNSSQKSRDAISIFIAVGILTLIGFIIFKSLYTVISAGRIEDLIRLLLDLLADLRSWTPSWAHKFLPDNIDKLKVMAEAMMGKAAAVAAGVSVVVVKFFTLSFIGSVIGVLFTLGRPVKEDFKGFNSFICSSVEQVVVFAQRFKIILFSQFWVAVINTIASFLYLSVILPAFDIQIPFKSIAILVTFLASLIPILGNLICNTLITVLSLSCGIKVAIASLAYLMILHKAEYFIVAKVVGTQIKCRVWEIVSAIVVCEAVFGLVGLIIAPVLYIYIKEFIRLNYSDSEKILISQ